MKSVQSYSSQSIKTFLSLNFILALLLLFVELFKHGIIEKENFWINEGFILIHFVFAIVNVGLSYYNYKHEKNLKTARFLLFILCDIYLIMCVLWMFGYHNQYVNIQTYVIVFGNFLALMAIGYQVSKINYSKMHPAFLIALSFLFLIILGTIALMLPHATVKDIDFLEALFTATSAVTVTGLSVLDTGKDFTFLGKVIILILIQLGGIGIFTVTNLFSTFLKSEHSYKERMMLTNMTNEVNSANAFKKLFQIVTFTLIIEAIGVVLIYFNVRKNVEDPFLFSIFHSISSFCNAGFSTLSRSVFEDDFKFNYSFQLILIWLLTTGAMGYNVMIYHYTILRNRVYKFCNALLNTKFRIDTSYRKGKLNIILATRTTIILLIFGTLVFYFLEKDNVLVEHTTAWGKFVVSFFNSATPRTAGFNNVDMSLLGKGTLLLIMFLMWIGASPGSTGGGIKTTTFAVAYLNLRNQIRGKDKIIINYRQIPTQNILIVNTIIILSLLTIGLGSFILMILNPELSFEGLLFECISAYSTVGLSVGITGDLTTFSKIILIVLMFFGRISFFTLLIGLIGQFSGTNTQQKIIYPKENIFI